MDIIEMSNFKTSCSQWRRMWASTCSISNEEGRVKLEGSSWCCLYYHHCACNVMTFFFTSPKEFIRSYPLVVIHWFTTSLKVAVQPLNQFLTKITSNVWTRNARSLLDHGRNWDVWSFSVPFVLMCSEKHRLYLIYAIGHANSTKQRRTSSWFIPDQLPSAFGSYFDKARISND